MNQLTRFRAQASICVIIRVYMERKKKTTEGENCNEFTTMQFVMTHLLIMGFYILQKGQWLHPPPTMSDTLIIHSNRNISRFCSLHTDQTYIHHIDRVKAHIPWSLIWERMTVKTRQAEGRNKKELRMKGWAWIKFSQYVHKWTLVTFAVEHMKGLYVILTLPTDWVINCFFFECLL